MNDFYQEMISEIKNLRENPFQYAEIIEKNRINFLNNQIQNEELEELIKNLKSLNCSFPIKQESKLDKMAEEFYELKERDENHTSLYEICAKYTKFDKCEYFLGKGDNPLSILTEILMSKENENSKPIEILLSEEFTHFGIAIKNKNGEKYAIILLMSGYEAKNDYDKEEEKNNNINKDDKSNKNMSENLDANYSELNENKEIPPENRNQENTVLQKNDNDNNEKMKKNDYDDDSNNNVDKNLNGNRLVINENREIPQSNNNQVTALQRDDNDNNTENAEMNNQNNAEIIQIHNRKDVKKDEKDSSQCCDWKLTLFIILLIFSKFLILFLLFVMTLFINSVILAMFYIAGMFFVFSIFLYMIQLIPCVSRFIKCSTLAENVCFIFFVDKAIALFRWYFKTICLLIGKLFSLETFC